MQVENEILFKKFAKRLKVEWKEKNKQTNKQQLDLD